jgi:hypothetical protein
MAFPRAATMETAVNGFRNSGLWPVDRCVFTGDDVAPSMVIDRPEIIQLERPTTEWIDYFILSPAHAAKPAAPKQTPCCNGYIPMEKIIPLPSNPAERPRPKSRRKHTASGVLTVTLHKESLNGPNIAGLSGAKPKRKTLCAKTKAVAQKKQSHQMLRRLAALFPWKRTMKTTFSARGAELGHMKTVPN